MGLRLHSAKKYDIQYGTDSSFNYQQHLINPIIGLLAEYDISSSDDYLEYSYTVEANRENLMNNIEKILQPDPNWEHQEDLNKLIEKFLEYNKNNCNITKEYLYNNLKSIIEQADPSNTDVYFAWF